MGMVIEMAAFRGGNNPIETAAEPQQDQWADLHAEFAHHAALEDAREAIRQSARDVSPERLNAAITTLLTGDAYDRWIAELLIEEQASIACARARLVEELHDLPIPDPREGMGAIVWLMGSALTSVLLIAALIVWVGLLRAERPAECQTMTASECTAWAQEQDGAR